MRCAPTSGQVVHFQKTKLQNATKKNIKSPTMKMETTITNMRKNKLQAKQKIRKTKRFFSTIFRHFYTIFVPRPIYHHLYLPLKHDITQREMANESAQLDYITIPKNRTRPVNMLGIPNCPTHDPSAIKVYLPRKSRI